MQGKLSLAVAAWSSILSEVWICVNESYIDWLRDRVGTRKVFLVFATVVARDGHGRILVQRRTDFDFWGLPGGVLELDEQLETCARRELLEETGLIVGTLRLVGVYTDPRYDVTYPNGDQVQQYTICFEGQVTGGEMQPDGLETSEQAFFTVEELQGMTIPLWYRDMIGDAQRKGPPAFKPPYTAQETADQIAGIRSCIGTALFTGVGASAIISRQDGRILMLQHAGESHWRHPAGYSELGENVAQTAVREVWEETRLHIKPQSIIAVYASPRLSVTYANGDRTRIVGVGFRAQLLGGSPRVDGREIREMAWMLPQEILSQVNPSRRWFYEKIMAHLRHGYFIC